MGVDGMDGVCSFLQVVAGRWLASGSGGWCGGTSETSGRAGATETREWHFGFLHRQTWVQVFLWSSGHPPWSGDDLVWDKKDGTTTIDGSLCEHKD